jgi:fructokinase
MTATRSVGVVGEALVDVVHSLDGTVTQHPGGSPLNVAIGLARLGVRTSLYTQLGLDSNGQLLHSYLDDNGVSVITAATRHAASIARATLNTDGAASYEFQIDWAIPHTSLTDYDMVHCGSLATVLDPGAHVVLDMIHEARATALVSFDPNCRPSIVEDRALGRRRAEDFVQATHVVKASDEDLEWLYPDRHWRDSADNWLAMGPAMVVVTRGPRGSFAINQSCWAELPVPSSLPAIVDTVGAGDSFMAAILWHLHSSSRLAPQSVAEFNSDELTALLRVAGHAAGLTCSRSGANPPGRDELMRCTTVS